MLFRFIEYDARILNLTSMMLGILQFKGMMPKFHNSNEYDAQIHRFNTSMKLVIVLIVDFAKICWTNYSPRGEYVKSRNSPGSNFPSMREFHI